MINKTDKTPSEDWSDRSWDARAKPNRTQPNAEEFRKYERERPPPKPKEQEKESIFSLTKKDRKSDRKESRSSQDKVEDREPDRDDRVGERKRDSDRGGRGSEREGTSGREKQGEHRFERSGHERPVRGNDQGYRSRDAGPKETPKAGEAIPKKTPSFGESKKPAGDAKKPLFAEAGKTGLTEDTSIEHTPGESAEIGAFEGDIENQQDAFASATRAPADPSKLQQSAKQAAEMAGVAEEPETAESPHESKPSEKKEKVKEGKASSLEKGDEKAAASAVNAPIQQAGFQAEKAQEAAPARSQTIQQLAAQIVEKVQVMREQGQTSTIITLRQPPELAGATITLTSTDNAKREFNISFANLSQDGKLLLEQKLQQDPLAKTLETKGIIVHQLTTSTEPEKLFASAAGEPRQGQPDQQQKEEQRKQQPFQMTEEEEE
jgi:hypothetical protein